MNDLQRAELRLLENFIDVCEKLGLTYFLVCGSALGAAKYGGFIPWDDDIDVALPRDDYEKFCRMAGDMLPEYCFLQNYKTDPAFPMIFSKIRDKRTTYIEKSMAELDICHGVYIDVFPLDGYPENEAGRARIEKEKKKFSLKTLCCFSVRYSKKAAMLARAESLLGFRGKSAKFVRRLEEEIAKYPCSESRIWCNHGNWQGKLEYAPRDHYGKGATASFEGLSVRIPEKYDAYLTQKYGDWRADIPDEEKKGHHYYTVCDTSRPYTDFVNRKGTK